MAKYESRLEDAADALARKQLGIEPKKDGVEQQERLPELYVKFKNEYLSVLEDSFKEVCGTMKAKLGVKDLSDDTLLIVANKISEKATSGNLKYVKDLAQDKEIASIVEYASQVQKRQNDINDAIERDDLIEGKENVVNNQEVNSILPMAEAFEKEMDKLNDALENWNNIDYDKLKQQASNYLDGETRKERMKALEVETLKKFRDAKTPEEKLKQANIIITRKSMAGALQLQLDSIGQGKERAIAGSIFSAVRMIAIDTDRGVDEILAEYKTMAIHLLGEDKAKKVLQEFDCIKGVTDRDQAVSMLVDRFIDIVGRENGSVKSKEEILKIAYRTSIPEKTLHELGDIEQMTDEQIEERAEQNIDRRETRGMFLRNRFQLNKKNGKINYDELHELIQARENLDPKDFAAFMKKIANVAVERNDLNLLAMHQEYVEREKQEHAMDSEDIEINQTGMVRALETKDDDEPVL